MVTKVFCVSVPSSSGLPSFSKNQRRLDVVIVMSLSPLHRGFLPSEFLEVRDEGDKSLCPLFIGASFLRAGGSPCMKSYPRVSVPSSSGLPSFPHRKYLNAINYLQVVLYNPRRNSFGHARYPGILVHTAVNRLLVAATQPGAYTLFARIPA